MTYMLSVLTNAHRVPLPLPQNGTNGTNGRTALLCVFTEVCEGHVRDHDLEATYGWDALTLLRDHVAHAIALATQPGMPLACSRTAQDGPEGTAPAVSPTAGR